MSKAILGKKLGMTQVFTAEGQLVPVTVVETTPSVVVRVKTVETDGYEAVQIGYGSIKEKHLTKPVKGQFDKAGVAPVKYLREVRVDSAADYTVGQTLAADIFAEGELVDVVGTIGPMISGGGGKVYKGKKLPGQMGGYRVTVQRLSVVKVDAERNLLLVKGGIPGAKGSLVMVRNTVKPVK